MNPAVVVDAELVAALREDLAAASWDVDRVEELLGEVAAAALAREQRVPGVLALRGSDDPAALLTRLFILGDEVDDAGRALPRLGVEGAVALGLLDPSGRRARVDLRPHSALIGEDQHDWWVASDLSESQTGRPLDPDHVLGIGSATLSLLRMTVREPAARALDLGTGCGIQALYLSTHASHVVATDISERACQFTRFNALLNGVRIDVRRGSLFDPVAGESFDLIVSNPPFVITPAAIREGGLMEYRDGGMDRDNLIAEVMTTAPGYLAPGGLLQMLANWEIRTDAEGWDSRPRALLAEAARACAPDGLRAWVVMRELVDYTRYAELWMRDSGGQFVSWERWEADYAEWVRDFTAAKVDHIAMGFLAVRRDRAIPGLFCEAQALMDGVFPDGAGVERALANLVLPADWDDRRLARPDDVREERYYIPGETDPQIIRLTQGAGMARTIQVSSQVAALVGASDGELTIGQIVAALAVLTDVEVAQVRAEILAELPPLLQAGMVRFLGSPGPSQI